MNVADYKFEFELDFNDLSMVDFIFTFSDFDTVNVKEVDMRSFYMKWNLLKHYHLETKISSTITSKGVRLNVTKTVDLLRRQNIRAYLVEY